MNLRQSYRPASTEKLLVFKTNWYVLPSSIACSLSCYLQLIALISCFSIDKTKHFMQKYLKHIDKIFKKKVFKSCNWKRSLSSVISRQAWMNVLWCVPYLVLENSRIFKAWKISGMVLPKFTIIGKFCSWLWNPTMREIVEADYEL